MGISTFRNMSNVYKKQIGGLEDLFNVKNFSLNDKGKYEGFWQDIGYSRKWFSPEDSYWWPEDLAKDVLEKEKVFGDQGILLTRNLEGKLDDSRFKYLGEIFKGPISPTDFWIPEYGLAEVKYTGDSQRDTWGYDLTNKAAMNIWSTHAFIERHEKSTKIWANNKLYLIVVHNPGPGDKISISIIDLYDKFKFPHSFLPTEPSTKRPFSLNTHHININVSAPDCLKRFDDIPYRKYRARCHGE
jgi:hypothetical protein